MIYLLYGYKYIKPIVADIYNHKLYRYIYQNKLTGTFGTTRT